MSTLRVLVACEYSGVVRDAFRARGHDALSCDILPTEVPGPHYQGSVLDILDEGWDLMVAHPPCTYLTNTGARWLYEQGTRIRVPERWQSLREGAEFFRCLWEANIPRIAVENPKMVRYAKEIIGRGMPLEPTQSIQPYQFGHMETKLTALWLKNLPALTPTNDVKAETYALPYGERAKVHFAAPGPNRWRERSRTYSGIAEAMADQWGSLPPADYDAEDLFARYFG